MQPDGTTPPRKRAPGRPKTPLVERTCEMCASPFMTKPWTTARFCSPACFADYRKRRIANPCEQCGTLVETIPSRKQAGKGRFCSKACFDAAQIGDIPARFAALVDRNAPGACWPWIGNVSRRTGYGQLTLKNRSKRAHALAWEIATGQPVPRGAFILHTCDYRRCVRNDDTGVYVIDGIEYPRRGHLVLADHKANMRDMAIKKRAAAGDRHAFRMHPEIVLRGEQSARAKLTDAHVIEIRRRYAAGGISQQSLADEYGVNQTVISRVVLRHMWKHLP